MNPMLWLNPGRWLLMLAAFAAITLGYFTWRTHQRAVGHAQAVVEYARQAKTANDERATIAPIVEKQEAAKQAEIRTVFKTIDREVIKYVKADSCPMPAGFRVLHDAAADGRVPDPSAVTDAAPVPAQDVAGTVIDNYQTCHEIAARLSGLQSWVRQQQELNK